MKNLAASRHFQKQLKKLPQDDQEKAVTVLKGFLEAIKTGKIPSGLGFKKINGDKYEIRVNARIRIAMKAEGDTFVCHLIGSHDDIRRYLRDYRNR